MLKTSILDMGLKIINLRLQLYLPGAMVEIKKNQQFYVSGSMMIV